MGVINLADWFIFNKYQFSKTKANFLIEYVKAFSCIIDYFDSLIFDISIVCQCFLWS